MLFTLLGVIALVLRERRNKVNNTYSGQHGNLDQSEGSAARSSDDLSVEERYPETTGCSLSKGCDSDPETLRSCDSDPETAGCSTSKGCDSDPETAGCSTSKGCDSDPETAGCSTSKGCDSDPETLRSCDSDPENAGCCTTKDSDPEIVGSSTSDGSDSDPATAGSSKPKDGDRNPQTAGPSTSKGCDRDPQAAGLSTSKGCDSDPQTACSSTSKGCDNKSILKKDEIIAVNNHKYKIGDILGEEGLGIVHTAIRETDGLELAVKCVPIEKAEFIQTKMYPTPLPVELAMLSLANETPRADEIIQLIDWVVKPNCYIMVLKRPIPCQSLQEFVRELHRVGHFNEFVAADIMRQAVVAAQTCCKRGVFPCGIMMKNILINPTNEKITLINFETSRILTDEVYTSFWRAGTEYSPPEYKERCKYNGEPTTVWLLGMLMFEIFFMRLPTLFERNKIRETKDLKKKNLSSECISFLCRCLEPDPERRIELKNLHLHDWIKVVLQKDDVIAMDSNRYRIGRTLGKGGFGAVYAATRLEDGLEVAVKAVPTKYTEFINIPGYDKPLPKEIGLHKQVNDGATIEEIIKLLDWRVGQDHYYMVLERPMPCQSLFNFVMGRNDPISEDVAKIIMRQAVFAVQKCFECKVFHGDIKLENFLINVDTLKIKLIDFGCSEVFTDKLYTSFIGTHFCRPPEYSKSNRYRAEPAAVWACGILLFDILFKEPPKKFELQNISSANRIRHLSKDCKSFICCCLEPLPNKRIEFKNLILHDWLK